MKKTLILALSLIFIMGYNECIAKSKDVQYNYAECFTYDSFSDWTFDSTYQSEYENIIPLHKKVLTDTYNQNLSSMMGIINYDSQNSYNPKTIGATYAIDRSIFLGWNFLDYYISGTNSNDNEHFISPPTPAEINIGHKNGVMVLGTVDFYWGAEGTRGYSSFCTGKDTTVGELEKMANDLNFDGWFINDESSDDSSDLKYICAKLVNDGYTAIYYDGSNNAESGDCLDKGILRFTDYNWGIENFMNLSSSEKEKLFLGIQWASTNQDTSNTSYLYQIYNANEGLSAAFYAIEYPIQYSSGDQSVTVSNMTNAFAAKWFFNANNIEGGDPVTVGDYEPKKTSITNLPFETNFNVGRGLGIFYNGMQMSSTSWGDLSQQDYLPYYYINNTNVSEAFDFTSAWKGGSSLKISNMSETEQTVPVFLTSINNTSGTTVTASVIYKDSGEISGASMIINTNQEDVSISLSNGTNMGNDYFETSCSFPCEGTITGVSFSVNGKETINIGSIVLSSYVPSKTIPFGLPCAYSNFEYQLLNNILLEPVPPFSVIQSSGKTGTNDSNCFPEYDGDYLT